MRVIGVLQARMGSHRLPGKVLADIGGEPAIVRQLRWLRTVNDLDAVCVAVPSQPESQPIADAIRGLLDEWDDLAYYAPNADENDVLARYAEAALLLDADVVVRCTADTPLLDPRLVSESVRRYLSFKNRPGYYWMQGAPRGCGDAEIFSRTALDDAAVEETDAKHREHVYFAVMRACLRRNEAILTPWVPDAIRRPTYRVCLDEPADLDVIRAIVAELGEQANSVQHVVSLLDSRPDIRLLNSQVQQVSA